MCLVSGWATGEHATGMGDFVLLAWQLSHPTARDVQQQSFELYLEGEGDSRSSLNWRSGTIHTARQSADTADLASHLQLTPGTAFRWRVHVVLSTGDVTKCGGSFETAPAKHVFPGPSKWIGGSGGQLHAVKGLPLPAAGAAIQRARAYVSGVGAFYLYVNGAQVGQNIMDPPQSVYSQRVLYQTFDISPLLRAGQNTVDVLLGNYKFGYTDIWCNMTAAGGPNGCRALILRIDVTMSDGSTHVLDTSSPHTDWTASTGPVSWDHFFHGENFSSLVDAFRSPNLPARVMSPPAGFPPGMEVLDSTTRQPIALGRLSPSLGPPLRVMEVYAAQTMRSVRANAVGSTGWVWDFGSNFAGMTRLSLPAGHGLPAGTQLRIEQAEIVAGDFVDTGGMCKLCPQCGPCPGPDNDADVKAPAMGVGSHSRGNSNCAANNAAEGAVCDTYCATVAHAGLKPLRHEPCFPHQSYKGERPHETPDRYVPSAEPFVLIVHVTENSPS